MLNWEINKFLRKLKLNSRFPELRLYNSKIDLCVTAYINIYKRTYFLFPYVFLTRRECFENVGKAGRSRDSDFNANLRPFLPRFVRHKGTVAA